MLDLPQIPVGVGERQIDDRHVLSNALDLLRVPEREGVVVAGGDEDAVRLDRLQQVIGEVARQRLALSRCGQPVAGEWDQRDREERRPIDPAACLVRLAAADKLAQPLHDCRQSDAHPDAP